MERGHPMGAWVEMQRKALAATWMKTGLGNMAGKASHYSSMALFERTLKFNRLQELLIANMMCQIKTLSL